MTGTNLHAVMIRDAVADDAALLVTLIKELAEYERLTHKLKLTAESLKRWLWGPDAAARAVIAEADGAPAGYAVFFRTFSTFRGQPGMYLEDIFVRPALRGRGIGEALMRHVANVAKVEECSGLQWVVLNWNQPAIEFYQRLGAKPDAPEWTTYSLDSEGLNRLARPEG